MSIKKQELIERFQAFDIAWRELSDGWDLWGPEKFEQDYPFEMCFNDMFHCNVKQWVQTSINSIVKAKLTSIIRIFYANGGWKDYIILFEESAGNYIRIAMDNSKDKTDDKKVVGGKLMKRKK